MLEYNLGEMKSKDGSILWYEVQNQASQHAISISYLIASMSVFKELAKRLLSSRTLLYYQYTIKKEILPFVRQACVIRWYNLNGKQIPPNERKVVVPNSGVFSLLKECWEFQEVDIELVNHLLFNFSENLSSAVFLKGYVKKHLLRISKSLKRSKYHSPRAVERNKGWRLACHYAEGFNPRRRNDLNWYEGCGITPDRVLIYFDSRNNKTGRCIDKSTVDNLEQEGFQCVFLKWGIVEGRGHAHWYPPPFDKEMLLRKGIANDSFKHWVASVGNKLLREVHYWRSFYDDFNIKINYIPEEGALKNIAQAIAFDIREEISGALLGKQRSEIFLPFSYHIVYHPKHIFFTWNRRSEQYLGKNHDQIETLVVTGYPNNILRHPNDISGRLRSKGANFIIALFDNAYGGESPFSENEISRFYRSFLQWVIDDPEVGLIIKSKKPKIIGGLISIHPLLDEALRTDRCVRIEEEWGRFPSEASAGADIALGCGISSAVVEAVIAGCRGVHYDMLRLRDHEFYSWGYEKLIFDDLERMIRALKRYKQDPQNVFELGDWSRYMDLLDPFRDGIGGERMGTYMRWLLEAFDEGKDRQKAIEYANQKYAKAWGEDKIIDTRYIYETA